MGEVAILSVGEGSWGGAMCPTDDIVAHLPVDRP